MSALFSIGAMNQLGDALQNAGFSPSDVSKLKQYKDLGRIKDLLDDQAVITYKDFLVDTNYLPGFSKKYKIIDHQKSGNLFLSKDRLVTYLHPLQSQEESILGAHILGDLAPHQKLNVAIADFLLKNVSIIPDAWCQYRICFWGTLFKVPVHQPSVLYIYNIGDVWTWDLKSISENFSPDFRSATLLPKTA